MHFILLVGGIIHKMQVRGGEIAIPIVSLCIMVIWAPLEYSRIRFGYRGNINEAFTEIVAFLAFTSFFVIPLSAAPVMMIAEPPFLPHERTCLGINLVFLIAELIVALALVIDFYQTQSAVFYLRTAPLIDKNFMKKYSGANDIASTREVQLGMQKYDKERDFPKPFEQSDRTLLPHGEVGDLPPNQAED